MKSKFLNPIVVITVLLLSNLTGRSQSLVYSNVIAGMNPVGYWPMHEVATPAAGDIETNYGSLGVLGTGYYPDYQVNNGAFLRQLPGALANDPDTSVFFTGPAGGGTATNGLFVPHTSPLSTLNPPFSLECWFMATNIGSGQGDILSQADGSKTGGLRLYYQNSAPNDPVNLLTYDGVASGQLNFTTTSFPTNQWHHLVMTCDASTNFSAWWDGAKVSGPTSLTGKYKPDSHQPFAVGTGLGNARAFHGLIDEVAVYTNVISDISQHFSDGSSGSAGQYFNDVTNDHPVIYLRMNSQPYVVPDISTWPALLNYGLTNGGAMSNGVYTPGTMPGVVAGGAYQNFPVGLIGPNVPQFSGVSSFADAGFDPTYNPTGTNSFSVAAMFRGNPTDTNRVQSIVGHGTNSWELGLTVGGSIVFNSGTNSAAVVATGSGAGDLTSTTSGYDDGRWHQVVAVHNNTTNVLYVDGVPNNTNIVTANNTGNSLDVMIGSDPCYTNTPIGLGRQFAGQICEVAFFTNALTPAQVQTAYNQSGLLPSVTVSVTSAAVSAGSSFTDTATVVGGSTPLSYQWYNNGALLSGQTNLTLTINPVLPGSASTNYYFVASNSFGSATSPAVSLIVYSTPTLFGKFPITYTNPITLYGASRPSIMGSTPTFSVSAVGGQPLTYQWTTNSVAVSGATNSSFTFTNCQMSSPTTFSCVLSNSYGAITTSWSVVYAAAPNAPFPQAVLADQPIAYWRLNEPDDGAFDGNNGAICNDYQSGNNGTYTTVYLSNFTLGSGYSPSTDPNEKAAEFGIYSGSGCFAGSIATNIDFSGSSNAEFTIAIWANGNSTVQPGNAGLVTKGYFNGEEFTIDEGASGSALRFGVRAAVSPNTFYGANSTAKLGNDSNWHFVVGVCDELNDTVLLYVDGQLAATNHLPANSGLITTSTAVPIIIGARSSSAGTPGNNQFKGLLNDAAVFNYAMNSNQVLALFQAAGVAPSFTQAPASTNVNYGGVLTISSSASGSAPLFYQWYDANLNTALAGQTNAALVVSNYTTSDSYYLIVSNSFGFTNSGTVSATVYQGAPTIVTDVRNPFYGIEGKSAANTVAAYGTAPVTYQWQIWNGASWINLTDNGKITGSQSPTLNIGNIVPGDAGLYQVIVSNSLGTAPSSQAQLIVAGLPLNFYTNGLFWSSNGSARISGDLLSLTDPNNGGGTGSFFYQVPQYIGAFAATFTYQAGGNRAADGMSFCLQNDSRGTSALGGGGGQLGVGGTTGGQITPSVELMMDIFGGSEFAWGTNGTNFPNAGANSGNFAPPGIVSFNGGDPIEVTLLYYGGYLALTFTDTVLSNTFSTNLNVGDITSILGTNTALIGFTGSYGGSTSVQTITNFSFVSLATQELAVSGHNAVVSWPGPIVGYQLQENANLRTTNWLNVTNADNITNGQHQIVMPLNGSNLFYRLKLAQ